jgi:hypothetical protein
VVASLFQGFAIRHQQDLVVLGKENGFAFAHVFAQIQFELFYS